MFNLDTKVMKLNVEGCLMEMGVLSIWPIDNGRKHRFADFAFPKQMEREVCQFHIAKMDRNGGLPMLCFRNGRKQRFSFCHRWKWNFHFHPFLSSPFSVFHFLFSVSGPA